MYPFNISNTSNFTPLDKFRLFSSEEMVLITEEDVY